VSYFRLAGQLSILCVVECQKSPCSRLFVILDYMSVKEKHLCKV